MEEASSETYQQQPQEVKLGMRRHGMARHGKAVYEEMTATRTMPPEPEPASCTLEEPGSTRTPHVLCRCCRESPTEHDTDHHFPYPEGRRCIPFGGKKEQEKVHRTAL